MTQYYSRVTYNQGDSTIFTIPFDYINDRHIKVYIDDTELEEGNSGYVFLNSTQIQIKTNIPSGSEITIKRQTPIDEKIVTYRDTSMVLNDKNLNLSQDQLLNAIQEIYDDNIIFKLAEAQAREAYETDLNFDFSAFCATEQQAREVYQQNLTGAFNDFSASITAQENQHKAEVTNIINAFMSDSTSQYNSFTSEISGDFADLQNDYNSFTVAVNNQLAQQDTDIAAHEATMEGYAETIDETLSDLEAFKATIKDGKDGVDGQDGVDGFSPTVSVTQTSTGATITATDKNGTSSANITNGAKGDTGQDGFSPTLTITKQGTVTTVTATDKNGTTSSKILDGSGSISDVRVNNTSVVNGDIANINISQAGLSGSYNDLSNKPTIPDVSNFVPKTNGKGTISNANDFVRLSSLDSNNNGSGITVEQNGLMLGYNDTQNDTSNCVMIFAPTGAMFMQGSQNTPRMAMLGVSQTNNLTVNGDEIATQSFVISQGYTSNTGTVTSVNNIQPDNNGNVTIPTGDNIYIAEYNVTNYADINTAYNSGKTLFCKYVLGNNNVNFYSLVRKDTVNNAYIFSNIIDTLSDKLTINSSNVWSYSGTTLAQASGLLAKQDRLVSGTNIKTVNNTSLLGSGNIDTSEVFIAEYDVTDFADIKSAYDNGKAVFVNNHGFLVPITLYSSSRIEFFGVERYLTNYVCRRIVVTLNNNTTNWFINTVTLEQTSNKVTSLSPSSTDAQYPSAKCVYDICQSKVTITYED